MVELRPITEENFEDCINLDVREEQQDFIAENMCSLAEAYVAMTSGPVVPMPYGVYDAEQDNMVGFLMIGYAEEGDEDLPEPFYCIWRIMTDANCQKMGYGTAALQEAVKIVKEYPLGEAKKLCAAYSLENSRANKLFKNAGFVVGEPNEDGNVLTVLDI